MRKSIVYENFKIDNFDLQQGMNFDRLESIVKMGYMSCEMKKRI